MSENELKTVTVRMPPETHTALLKALAGSGNTFQSLAMSAYLKFLNGEIEEPREYSSGDALSGLSPDHRAKVVALVELLTGPVPADLDDVRGSVIRLLGIYQAQTSKASKKARKSSNA